MSCVVYLKNKKSGYMYAYESVSYRDPITRKPRSKRTFIGRVDPVTKELLDPDKAQRLKEKREQRKNKNPPIHEDNEPTSVEFKHPEETVIEELRQIKEILLRDHEELKKLKEYQERTRKTVLSSVQLFQDSFASL